MPDALTRLSAAAEILVDASLSNLPGVTAAVLGIGIDADGEFMDTAGSSLLVVARHGIGVDNVDIPAATERGILVINTPDAPSESTAEHAVGLLLAVAKRIVAGDMSLRGIDIPRPQLMGTEVAGRSLGVVGCGRIGRRVAEICAVGLKMRVVTYDPHCAEWAEQAGLGIKQVDNLDELLAQADFVTLHPSFTQETYHLIGERELRLMKPGAYLINTSRGPVGDELALARVLGEGHLAGAAMDVFDPEPPSPDHPLLRLSNVVVTPHMASYTDLGYQKMSDGVVDQLLQIFQGERPTHLVNPEVWPGRLGAAG
jgi:phosphoglycerate dehydrogenase-like enzyme